MKVILDLEGKAHETALKNALETMLLEGEEYPSDARQISDYAIEQEFLFDNSGEIINR